MTSARGRTNRLVSGGSRGRVVLKGGDRFEAAALCEQDERVDSRLARLSLGVGGCVDTESTRGQPRGLPDVVPWTESSAHVTAAATGQAGQCVIVLKRLRRTTTPGERSETQIIRSVGKESRETGVLNHKRVGRR